MKQIEIMKKPRKKKKKRLTVKTETNMQMCVCFFVLLLFFFLMAIDNGKYKWNVRNRKKRQKNKTNRKTAKYGADEFPYSFPFHLGYRKSIIKSLLLNLLFRSDVSCWHSHYLSVVVLFFFVWSFFSEHQIPWRRGRCWTEEMPVFRSSFERSSLFAEQSCDC